MFRASSRSGTNMRNPSYKHEAVSCFAHASECMIMLTALVALWGAPIGNAIGHGTPDTP